jgi:hypothetical protein
LNESLKLKYFCFYFSDERVKNQVAELSFGDNPSRHYATLLYLYDIQVEELKKSHIFDFDHGKDYEKIKQSIQNLSEQLHKFPILKFPPTDCGAYLNLKKKKIIKTSSKFHCTFCEESFDKSESLGGHNKLHTSFT